jgi:hypothetical protein
MGSFLTPLNFAAIQGSPHQIPEKAIDKLPTFQGNNAISAKSHILSFDSVFNCIVGVIVKKM